ncbi:hypothetical protein KC340_g11722 [Hortaea werneckii]|nr:hypothetical protein KC342_g10548 [Hortaea werneckii]KAI7092890.1 hypothetical protein KC339_g12255 [Hortaea werneckii]KAI7231304.1 hypothetical protein KC365_g7260 [Hortaea werneckii]KAI7306392.1 hypothetical protein KC340_g11722 [Hortaea werneckii]KAI7377217.1 hypothetical protein KC328_g14525 [Hortaea werneckii]
MDTAYSPPLALTAISGVFLALGAACALVVAGDILLRRGWHSMMWIMIPVYIINATYMLPIELFVYFKYGRPSPPQKEGQITSKAGADADTGTAAGCHHHASASAEKKQAPEQSSPPDSAQSSTSPITNQTTNAATNPTHGRPAADNSGPQHESCETAAFSENPARTTAPTAPPGRSDAQDSASEPRDDFSASSETENAELSKPRADHGHGNDYYNSAAPAHEAAAEPAGGDGGGGGHCHMHASSRPMYATVLVGVSHCGAGCVLGDLVGEWLVYGTGATINGEMIWPELLIDYAFALLFGIIFQYFSIAPMSGVWGPKSVWRAAKADILSLTSFEIGCFGWMVAFQVGIFGYKLSMATWTYWWMMQIGIVLGFGTAMPVNWWLISQGIKEPCA